MEILFKENIIFDTMNNETELKEKVLDFIFNAKTDKILFKGKPENINYKLLKKILPLDKIKYDKNSNSINKFIDVSDVCIKTNVREVYKDFLEKVNCDYCIIYKK